MAHLLMIESFLEGNAKILPKLLNKRGHTYTFLTRDVNIYPKENNSTNHNVIKYAQSVIEIDTNNVEVIFKEVKNKTFDGVITTCDYYIEIVQEIAEKLNLPCPFPKNVRNVRYKHKLRQLIDSFGIDNPKYEICHNWEEVVKASEILTFPFVLKPVDLASSAYVRLIKNKEDLKEAFTLLEAFPINWREQKRDCTYLLEEYMAGNEVSVEAISFNGKTKILGITQKSITGEPYFIENAHMFPANLSEKERKEINDYVIRVLSAVEYNHGVSHTEVKITPNGPRIVEINPRVAGDYIAELIELVTGIQILDVFVELSIGRKPEIFHKETGIKSAAIMFLTPEREGFVEKIDGLSSLDADKNIVYYKIEDYKGKMVEKPVDNVGRLGRIVTKDSKGYSAMNYVIDAIKRIDVQYK